MRTVSLEEAKERLDELIERAVKGEDVSIAVDESVAIRLTPIAIRKALSPEEKAARRETILELARKVEALPDLDTRSLEEILECKEGGFYRIFGLDQGNLTVPDDFDAPMTEIEELFSNTRDGTEIRRKVVRALCRLAASLPVLDPLSNDEILSEEGEGFL